MKYNVKELNKSFCSESRESRESFRKRHWEQGLKDMEEYEKFRETFNNKYVCPLYGHLKTSENTCARCGEDLTLTLIRK